MQRASTLDAWLKGAVFVPHSQPLRKATLLGRHVCVLLPAAHVSGAKPAAPAPGCDSGAGRRKHRRWIIKTEELFQSKK